VSFSSFTTWFLSSPFSWASKDPSTVVSVPLSPLLLIATSIIVLLLIFSVYIVMMSKRMHQLNATLNATQLALVKEQKISSFGALAAAAAHELGSPLSTISLAAKDIVASLAPDSPLMEDVQLIISQGDRCRDILADLSRSMKEDPNKAQESLPLSGIIELAAHPHRLPHISFFINKEAPDPEPRLQVTPDLLHGLGNILQNAFQFANSRVRVTLNWDKEYIEAIIQDDGKGYPTAILPRLGEPQSSDHKDPSRKGGYKGMGLGLFLAKTLLAQRQAQVRFYNDDGACCSIKWPASIRVVNSEKKD
jgi:two-component system, sensor histidine kinase RegB